MKYDDASWHYGGDFPEELPDEAGGIHTAFFLTWLLLNGHASEVITEEYPEVLEELKNRSKTPTTVFFELDAKFVDDLITEKGNDFTKDYYVYDDKHRGMYLHDYEDTLLEGDKSLYYVEDTWENYDKIAKIISKRFSNWDDGGLNLMSKISGLFKK